MQFRKTGRGPSLVMVLFRPCGVRQLAALIWLSAVTCSVVTQAAQVMVSGATTLTGLLVLEDADRLVVSGVLADDARQPVAGVPLQAALSGQTAEVRFYPCDANRPNSDGLAPAGRVPSDGEPNTALLETDRLGRFCVALDKAAQGAQLTFHFAGDEHLLPSDTAVSLAPKPNQVLLSFASSELRVALNHTPQVIQVNTRAAQPSPPRTVAVTLWRTDAHTPEQLGEAVLTVIGQPAFFAVTAAQLGSPGLGELRARVENDEQSGAYEVVTKLTKTGTVKLAMQGPAEVLPPSNTWQFTVLAQPNPTAPVTGFVEVQRSGAPVVVAPLRDDGQATLRLEANMLGTAQQVTVSFVPSEPWWLTETPLLVSLPATPRRVARTAPWWAASLLLVTFFVWRAWQRPVPGRPRQAKSKPLKNIPQVIVVSAGEPQRTWSGRVLDADDGGPVPNATLRLNTVSFAERRLLAETMTDPTGWFAFGEGAVSPHPVTLTVTAVEHRPLEQQLERPAELAVRLKHRRRALISELVNWASLHQLGSRQAGVDPTPGQIAHSAFREGKGTAGAWAQSVEHAAFGDSPLDEQREGALRQQRPDPARDD